MGSLASALTSLNLEFSNDLTYPPSMAPESANKATLENGRIQVLSKGDIETYNKCRAMAKRGEYPTLRIVFDHDQGYTVHADDLIKHMTLIAEYTGDWTQIGKNLHHIYVKSLDLLEWHYEVMKKRMHVDEENNIQKKGSRMHEVTWMTMCSWRKKMIRMKMLHSKEKIAIEESRYTKIKH
ncbi:hypothetical protein L1987_46586 [Smallanthus sonchifolius]|uniref:Uncharacterized protein n=1 Tax=Smallanthus sonchifolius TaxID=185202 RepID=A0ACB9G0Q5_9ASTR|nr:hypothetical protein L1987_46586 [Smallanthus sonchifolius]